MSKELTTLAEIERNVATVAQNNLMAAVKTFGQYVDSTGAAATSERGLVIAINRAFKRHYGLDRGHMPRDMLMHASSALIRIVTLIDNGMRESETREAIKREIQRIIKTSGESYHAMTGASNADAA